MIKLPEIPNFKNILKSFFLIVILFLFFFGINLFIIVKNKPTSAYNVLNSMKSQSDSPVMLQDVRVHNWDELGKTKNK